MNKNRNGFANVFLIILVVVLAGALGYITLIKKPALTEQSQSTNPQPTAPLPSNNTVSQNPISPLESQILTAVNQALAGSAIGGYQPIPKGSKLLSAKVDISNNIAIVTLNFNKAIVAGGQAAFEDTFSLVTSIVHPIVLGEGKDPKYAGLNYVTLIEGKPLN